MGKRVLHDEFFKKAKDEGYLARSAYKLIELDDKRKLLSKGDRVLDLGCFPGSWLQVVERRIGPKGTAVGVDLQRVEHRFGPTVQTIQSDFLAQDPSHLVELAGGPFDTVLSDMAPATRGAGDAERSITMCHDVLGVAMKVLRPGGRLAMKILEGSGYPELLQTTRELFEDVRALKPKATRSVSREIFVTAKGFNWSDTRERM